MNSLSLILRILAVVAAIAAAALFFVSKGKLAEQQAIAEKAEQATAAVQAELATANEQVTTLEGQLNTEREALADAKRSLESIRSEMYTAKQEVSRTQQQLSEAKKSIESLENDTKRLRSDLLQAEQTIISNNKGAEIAQLNEQVAELEKANADLKGSLKMAKEQTNRPNNSPSAAAGSLGSVTTGGTYSSTFSPTASQPLPTTSIGAETTIQSVSTKNGLIVLANNSKLGLAPGVEVTLIRDLKALGKIQVVQLTDEVVVANILPGAKTREMIAGTTVSLMR